MTLLEAARDLLVPARCAGCATTGEWLCQACRDECEPRTLPSGGSPRLRIRGAGSFEGGLREAIHRFKYGAERGLSAELGALVASLVARDLAAGTPLDALVPVPLHVTRRTERGYDQAALLAASVAVRTGLPLVPALRRIRGGHPQVRLGRAARAENVGGAFVACAGSLRGLRVALVDDVATTGATLRAAAATTRAAGARAVRAYVIAVDD